MSPFPRPAYRPLERYAPDRRPVPVDLSDNTSLRGPHPAALAALEGGTAEDLSRYPPVYADRLVEALARSLDVPQECVTTGCGSDDLLDSLFRAAGEPGEAVVYLDPTFSMIPIFARMNGMEAVAVPGIPLPEPERLLERDPAVVYLCSPNNPTGEALPDGWVEELVERAARIPGGGPVVAVDEAYADFADRNWLTRAVVTPRMVVLRTFSKAYGLAGLRVGFAAGDPLVIGEMEKSRGPYKVTRVAEAAAAAALEDRSSWLADAVAEVREARERLASAFRERGMEPLPSRANFLLVPVPDAGAVTAGLRERGIAVRPFPGLPGIGDAVRISVGRWDYMERLLEAWDAIR